ncbi:MAG TPA: PHB depolymerase family esterase [Thermoanaerobaculia bacterium]|nr:PHB depolymerase family esterase [Thermoanaerobaculia bacterium]
MRAKGRILAVCALLVASGCLRCAPEILKKVDTEVFLDRTAQADDEEFHYRLYLPLHYHHWRSWPVILFLHGSGERGDDNLQQTKVGLGPALEKFRERYRCLVVLPQARAGEDWNGAMERRALAALDRTLAEFHGDPHRVYLTGVSLGGSGAWYMAVRYPRRFAAVVPVCGEVVPTGGDRAPADLRKYVDGPDPYMALARALGPAPVWVFHGSEDDQVPVAESRRMVTALKALKHPVRYTEFPELGHNSWDAAYADPSLTRWLFAQRLR